VATVVAAAAVLPSATSLDASDFQRSHSIASGFTFYWNVTGSEIVMGLEGPATGWVALGVGEPGAGSMPGADVLMCSNHGGAVRLGDYFTTDFVQPFRDGVEHATLEASAVSAGRMECVFRRALDTGETFADRPFVNESYPAKMIFAYGSNVVGDEPTFAWYHGSANAYTAHVNIFQTSSLRQQIAELPDLATDSMLVAPIDFQIPAVGQIDPATTYVDTCINVPSNANRTAVAFDVVLDPRSSEFMHHLTLTGFTSPNCGGASSMLWAWTPGQEPFLFPSDVGYPVGAAYGSVHAYQSFSLNSHYDNPANVANVLDSSGIRVHFTSNNERRAIEAGVLSLADGDVSLKPPNPTAAIPAGISKHDFQCSATATSNFPHSITVLQHFLHMHEIGKKQTTTVTRGNTLVFKAEVDFYVFAQQSPITNTGSYTIQPGDVIDTSCIMQHNDPSRTWGLGSTNEMCIDYVMYYPRLDGITKCGGPGPQGGGTYLGSSVISSIEKSFGGPQALQSPTSTPAPTPIGQEDEEGAGVSGSGSGSAVIIGSAVAAVVALVAAVIAAVVVRKRLIKRKTDVSLTKTATDVTIGNETFSRPRSHLPEFIP